MSPPVPTPPPSRPWHTAGVVLVSFAAGGAVRWATPDGLAFRSVEKVPPPHGSEPNAKAAEATPVRATIEELLALPPSQRLARLAECLPDLTAGDVVTLV